VDCSIAELGSSEGATDCRHVNHVVEECREVLEDEGPARVVSELRARVESDVDVGELAVLGRDGARTVKILDEARLESGQR
jgi:hypothetical protein